jgi:hypothetical protein
MSELTLNVLDAERAIWGRVHGGVADRLVASLGADPATIADWELAAGRFERHVHGRGVFDGFHTGTNPEPWDAGLIYVDLAARLVAYRSTYSMLLTEGVERWHDGESLTDEELPFRLADDWLVTENVEGFERLSCERRAARSGERVDERAVLYGRLPEFLVQAVWRRHAELAELDDDARYQFVKEIHAEWLLTPRDDLQGRSPREVMLDDRHRHLGLDLQYQEHHWSILRQPPPGLRRESVAYRFAGFGTHEIVLYYDLVRTLLFECVERLSQRNVTERDLPGEAEHLQRLRQDWLNTPNFEDLCGRTPAATIDRERRRLPEAASGEEAIIDPDCPCCQAMANDELFGPMFWHLDGYGMDDDFAFSFDRTREEWEAERRRQEEFDREFDRRWKDKDDMPF